MSTKSKNTESKKSRSIRLITLAIKESLNGLSFKSIEDLLIDNDLYVSERTIQRYIKELTDNLFIEYSYESKTYVMNSLANLDEVDHYITLLGFAQTVADELNNTSIKHKQNQFIVSANKDVRFKGSGYLKSILEALHKKRTLHFKYSTNFKDISYRNVNPLLVKEYQKRWYLIAYDMDKEALRIFGLDRISDLTTGEKEKQVLDFDEVYYKFKNMLGVDMRLMNNEYPNRISVKIKAFGSQPDNFRSLPLHHSQKEIEKKETHSVFEYSIFINYEFKQHLFMYAPLIEVLEPMWLRIQFKADLKEIIKRH